MRGAALLLLCVTAGAAAANEPCRTVEVLFKPAAHLQLAVWVEDDAGHYIDTVYVTRSTGALGLGNRPGNALFKSSYRWPYGRREMALPVWAHRRNHSYGYIVMGGGGGIDPVDDSIGYHSAYSSAESFYCPPTSLKLDAVSCASPFIGSKGIYAPGKSSLYPPRADLTMFQATDSADAMRFAADNDVSAISGATPPGGQLMAPALQWTVPSTAASGRYRVLVEASLEADFDAAHHHPSFPDASPELRSIGWDALGQPSVVYAVPILIDGTTQIATTADYQGYGSWDGSTGDLSPPDATIVDTPGSGAGRLLTVTDVQGSWRVEVAASSCGECGTPPPIGSLTATAGDTFVTLAFDAPNIARGSPDAPQRYDIRYRSGKPLDDDSFSDGIPADSPPTPGPPGSAQTATLGGLKAETSYSVGVRTVNACGTASTARFANVTTTKQQFAVLHGCFIATAAYGSPMEPEVALLRRFRERVLYRSPLGRLAAAIYYAHSPPLAAAISTDERLRRLARAALAPAVGLARAWLLADAARR